MDSRSEETSTAEEPSRSDGGDGLLSGRTFEERVDRPNLVLVFLSSTFRDFIQERNHLFNRVLPQIESWCQERGLEFEVVDMRWGVRDTASLSHGGVKMCLKEIENCRHQSIGPNFVAFVGDRYGGRPLPSEITASDFKLLSQFVTEFEDSALLLSWYQLDLNAIPPVYLLRSVTSVYPEYSIADGRNSQANINQEWEETESRLRRIIDLATQSAAFDNKLKHGHQLTASVTEQEIWAGVVNQPEPDHHALCFIRNFDKPMPKPDAKTLDLLQQFRDVSKDGSPDEISAQMLGDLKNFLLPEHLDDTNLFRFNVQFDKNAGIDARKKAHQKYLSELGSLFERHLKELITDGLREASKTHVEDATQEEVAAHAAFAVRKSQLYCARRSVLKQLYARLSDGDNCQPLILYGPSGVGKTATVAKLIRGAATHVRDAPNVVYRFLGTTPDSSNLDALLRSLARQLERLYDASPVEAADDEPDAKSRFVSALEAVSGNRPLVIILDSLDQLAPAFGAHAMAWLPTDTPRNVRLLLTVMAGVGGILDRLRLRLRDENLIELTHDSNDNAMAVLKRLLRHSGRKITSEQKRIVEKAFSKTQSPLLLHLTAIETRRWYSFTDKSQLFLGNDLGSATNALFERLETDHGRVLVSHALSYIVASRNGLTSKEVEEILSLDDQVLDDVYQYWAPPSDTAVRVPPLVWTRLRNDLSDFIVNRQSDGMTVMGMYHKQFTDAVLQRYMGDNEFATQIYQILAEYFAGMWHAKTKPLKLSRIERDFPSAKRNVRPQPLQFNGGRHNLRKLNELPYHLVQLCRLDSARYSSQLKSLTLLNYGFLSAVISAFGVAKLLEDFALATENLSDVDVNVVCVALRMVKATLEFSTDDQGLRLAVELLGRLHVLEAKESSIRQLLDECRAACERRGAETTVLMPQDECFAVPSGTLRQAVDTKRADVSTAHCSPDGRFVVAHCLDGRLLFFDAHHDALTAQIHFKQPIFGLTVAPDGQRAFGCQLKKVIVFDLASGFHEECAVDAANEMLLPNYAPTSDVSRKSSRPDARLAAVALCIVPGKELLAYCYNNTLTIISTDEPPSHVISITTTGDRFACLSATETLIAATFSNCILLARLHDLHVSVYNCSNCQQFVTIATENGVLRAVGNTSKQAIVVTAQIDKGEFSTTAPSVPHVADALATVAAIQGSHVAFATKRHLFVVTDKTQSLPLSKREMICALSVIAHETPLIAAAFQRGFLKLYDSARLALVAVLPGFLGDSASIRQSGNLLVSSSIGKLLVKLWDVNRILNPLVRDPITFTADRSPIQPTCYLTDNQTSVALVEEDQKTVWWSSGDGPQTKLTLSAEVEHVFELVEADQLLYLTKTLQLRAVSASKGSDRVVAKLPDKCLHYSYLPRKGLFAFLLCSKSVILIDKMTWLERVVISDVEESAENVCLTESGVLLFGKTAARLVSFNGELKQTYRWPHGANFNFCAGDNRAAFCRAADAFEVVDLATGKQLWARSEPHSVVSSLHIGANDRLLFVGFGASSDGGTDVPRCQIQVFDAANGNRSGSQIYVYAAVCAIRWFHPNYVAAFFDNGRFGRFKVIEPAAASGHKQVPRLQLKNQKSTACTLL